MFAGRFLFIAFSIDKSQKLRKASGPCVRVSSMPLWHLSCPEAARASLTPRQGSRPANLPCARGAGADGYFKSCTELRKQNPQRQPARCELNIAHRVSPGDIDRGEGGEDGVGVAVGVLDFLFLKVNVVGRCPDVARQAGAKKPSSPHHTCPWYLQYLVTLLCADYAQERLATE